MAVVHYLWSCQVGSLRQSHYLQVSYKIRNEEMGNEKRRNEEIEK